MNKKNKKKNKGGRPTIYTPELAQEICQRVADGESLLSISKDEKMPVRSTIHEWLLTRTEFSDKYNDAVNVRTENMFDELEKIADLPDEQESPMRSRLRVDTRKWYLSKVMPKKYGDKVDLTSDGKAIKGNIITLSSFKDRPAEDDEADSE